MRVHFPIPLLAYAAVFFIQGRLLAENVVRNEPQTEGEKRLLNWDLNKKFDTSLARFSSDSKASTKSFGTGSFQAKSFGGQKTYESKSFYTPEFLTPAKANTDKSFASKSASLASGKELDRPFAQANETFIPPKVQPVLKELPTSLVKPYDPASRTFAGPEAVRKEMKFTPGNMPMGGVSEGHVLTIDEVRKILNISK
jgi:hypothetical protein